MRDAEFDGKTRLSRNRTVGVNERFVGGQIGYPFAETDIDECSRLGMGILNRLQQGIPAALSQLVLDGLGDEPTAVSLESIDLLHEIGWQRDGDASHRWHVKSMPSNMTVAVESGLCRSETFTVPR